jgi:hypothetical protein
VPRLPTPRLLKDITAAQQAALPHQHAANAAMAKMRELYEELQDDHLGLSDEELAARRRELDDVKAQLSRENAAALRPMEDLKAKHPRWIK